VIALDIAKRDVGLLAALHGQGKLLLQHPGDGRLKLEVHGETEIATLHGRLGAFSQPANLATVGIALVEISALESAQLLLVVVLDALLANNVAGFVIPVLGRSVFRFRDNVGIVV
jgi:hypothetical protein